jgi:glycerol-3-phosphate O-acyltransferase
MTAHEQIVAREAQAAIFRREIAHRYSNTLACAMKSIVRGLLRTFFMTGLHVDGLGHVRSIPRGTPIIFSSVHKSHLDYLLLGMALHDGLHYLPATIAGKNLFHGLFRWLLPRLKGICLDRVRVSPKNLRSRENLLYLSTFYDYLMDEMMTREEMITIFPEGGRSYDGRLLPLTLGVFGIAKRALQHGAPRVAVVPVAVSYERVTEDARFDALHQAKQQSRRAYRKHDQGAFYQHALWQARGATYVDIGAPLYVDDVRAMDALESNLRARMGALVRVSAGALVGRALRGVTTMRVAALTRQIERDLDFLRAQHARFCADVHGHGTDVLHAALPHLCRPWRGRDIIAFGMSAGGPLVRVHDAAVLEYYANTVDHFFAPAGTPARADDDAI